MNATNENARENIVSALSAGEFRRMVAPVMNTSKTAPEIAMETSINLRRPYRKVAELRNIGLLIID